MAWRWRTALFRNDLLELPGKLDGYGRQIDYRAFPENTPEQVHALVIGVYALAYRIKDLIEAREYPQADLVARHVLDDVRAWRQVFEERFQRRAEDPTAQIEPAADVRDRLEARLARMEATIKDAFRQAGDEEIGRDDYQNFYRLLGCYRGLSEAAIGYAQLAEGIDWTRWHEARF